MSRPHDYFPYVAPSAGKPKELSVEGIPLREIAESYGTPVYVYSGQAFADRIRDLQKGLAGLDHLICFAVKANSNIGVLAHIGRLGAGADLVSGGELQRALRAGIAPERIVFSGVGKTQDEMELAISQGSKGILSFNVESVPELDILEKAAKAQGRRVSVALRYNPDVDPKTHPYISTGLKKNKFGLDKAEVIAIAKQWSRYPSLDCRGVSIHIGSQLLNLKPLQDSFARVELLVRELDKLLPRPLDWVDLGGGVGIGYDEKTRSPKIADYCKLIHKFFGQGKGAKAGKLGRPIRIILEPGRSVAGNAGVLVSRVLFRKHRKTKDFLVVDAAMNDLMRPSLYGSYHHIVPVQQSKGALKKADVVGPVCESSDCFGSDRKLPASLDSGDLIALMSAGAYGSSMSSTYNSRALVPEVLVVDGQPQLVRRRGNFEDLVRLELDV